MPATARIELDNVVFANHDVEFNENEHKGYIQFDIVTYGFFEPDKNDSNKFIFKRGREILKKGFKITGFSNLPNAATSIAAEFKANFAEPLPVASDYKHELTNIRT